MDHRDLRLDDRIGWQPYQNDHETRTASRDEWQYDDALVTPTAMYSSNIWRRRSQKNMVCAPTFMRTPFVTSLATVVTCTSRCGKAATMRFEDAKHPTAIAIGASLFGGIIESGMRWLRSHPTVNSYKRIQRAAHRIGQRGARIP